MPLGEAGFGESAKYGSQHLLGSVFLSSRIMHAPLASPPCVPAMVSAWAKGADGDAKLAAALRELQELRLLGQVARGGQAVWALNAAFQTQLRHAVCSGWVAVQAWRAAGLCLAHTPSPVVCLQAVGQF